MLAEGRKRVNGKCVLGLHILGTFLESFPKSLSEGYANGPADAP